MDDSSIELSQYLRACRAKLDPRDVPLPYVGGRRRVPGLRREELAQLAGVSADYYARLEQGKLRNVSDSVLESVARALGLGETERRYLFYLARPSRVQCPSPSQPVRPSLRWLLDSVRDAPAYILGRRTDILAWNDLASALLMVDLDAAPARRRNMARLVFLDEAAKGLWHPWEAKARDIVGGLRMYAGLYSEDQVLKDLIAELSVKSPEFRRIWAEHQVWTAPHGTVHFHHPVVGELDLSFDALEISDVADQSLIAYTAPVGSPSHTALRLLASWRASCVDAPVAVRPTPARPSD